MGSQGLLFYRCACCYRVISPWDLKEHASCCACGGRKMSPTVLTTWEKLVQIVKHPRVWTWKEMGQ